MNKWQAWWDKANEVIDAAPNGVEYYWLAARPTDAVPEVKLFRFEQIAPGQVEIVRHRIYFPENAHQPAARQEGRQTMGQEKQDASGRIMLSTDVFVYVP